MTPRSTKHQTRRTCNCAMKVASTICPIQSSVLETSSKLPISSGLRLGLSISLPRRQTFFPASSVLPAVRLCSHLTSCERSGGLTPSQTARRNREQNQNQSPWPRALYRWKRSARVIGSVQNKFGVLLRLVKEGPLLKSSGTPS